MKTRKLVFIFGFTTVVLLLGALVVGFITARQMKDIIAADFNQQQLVLAKHIASQIEERILSLEMAIKHLSLSPSIRRQSSWADHMQITMSEMQNSGLLEVSYIDKEGHTAHFLKRGGQAGISNGRFEELDYFKWCRETRNKGDIYISKVLQDRVDSERLTTLMAAPVYQEPIDEAHPKRPGRFAGVVCFTIDASALVRQPSERTRSGKTGYSWVIDSKGVFLYHPEKSFIGKNAFEVRGRREPKISFDKINYIQKEWMLNGEEGTSWYVSGWHRGMSGKIKKLIAYSPVYLEKKGPNYFSVAVVAPEDEIQDEIHSIYGRQFYIMLSVMTAILFLGTYIVSFESRWNTALKQEVNAKTEGLNKSNEELRKSEEKYKTLIEGAEDLIFTVDAEGKYLSMNRYGLRFLGAERPDEIVGKSIYDFFSEESANLQMEFIGIACEAGKSVNVKYPVEIGEKKYWFSTSFICKKSYILGISRDITERKNAEEQMYHTEKLASLGKLAAGVAHEINNPIAVILGYADILLEKIDPKDKAYEILKIIERQGTNCKRIVENLMGFARIREKAEYAADVNQTLEKVIAVVQNTLLTRKTSLKTDLAPNLPKVRGDSGQLQQVFVNLINNAVSAMNGEGTLTITTRMGAPGKVEILFSDTGQGIQKEYRSKIFDPFFTTKKVGEGTGLGLSVTYGILNNYGGEIRFETITKEEDEEKHGTTFFITLPVVHEGYGNVANTMGTDQPVAC